MPHHSDPVMRKNWQVYFPRSIDQVSSFYKEAEPGIYDQGIDPEAFVYI
jgi:hypothetical protein